MSVATPHPDYSATLATWDALEAAYIGSGAIKGAVDARSSVYAPTGVKMAGTRYLPRPAGMRLDAQYALYRDRASWYAATERAVHGLTGAIFRKEPTLEVPAAMEAHLRDVTQTGMPWQTFAEQAVLQTLLMGRYGVLVDFPAPDVTTTGRRAPPALSRPYWVGYRATEIRNWRTERRQGDTVLTLVVLCEWQSQVKGPWGTDEFFVVEQRPQYRVLRLDEANRYEVSVWREAPLGPGGQNVLVQDVAQTFIPLRSGRPLDFIPFIFLSPFTLEPHVQKSLMEALVEINFRYYRHSADYEHARFSLLPSPIICSDKVDAETDMLLGPSVVVLIPDSNAKFGMLAGDPAMMESMQQGLETDKQDMAMLGARLLEVTPAVAETATANQNRLAGAESPIQTLISTVSQGLTQALQIHAWWGGLTENDTDAAVRLQLNKDIIPSNMSPQLLQALMQVVLNGKMSDETFYYNLQQGELARPGVDFEEEQALMQLAKDQAPLAPSPSPGSPLPRTNGVTRTAV
jgi:hypothetical protein